MGSGCSFSQGSGLDDRSRAMVKSFERLIYVSCNPRRGLEGLCSVLKPHSARRMCSRFEYCEAHSQASIARALFMDISLDESLRIHSNICSIRAGHWRVIWKLFRATGL